VPARDEISVNGDDDCGAPPPIDPAPASNACKHVSSTSLVFPAAFGTESFPFHCVAW